MRIVLLLATSILAAPTIAAAQSMPGMDMSHHHHAEPPATKAAIKPAAPAKPKPKANPAPAKPVAPAAMPSMSMDAPAADAPARATAPSAATPSTDNAAMPGMAMPPADAAPPAEHDHADHQAAPEQPGQSDDMAGMAGMAGMDHAGHHVMKSAFGAYPGGRDSSGTSWQPDVSPHAGLHGMRGGWDLMLHGTVNIVYDNQSGPRGDDKAFVIGHIMGSAARDLSARDRLQFRVAVTPDPFMGPRGYPLLFATGETANGVTQLIDRQHPHDLVSELSVSLSHRFSDRVSGYLFYGGVGDPAFGPPAYIHRLSILDDPEAPISHHWLDSMHGTPGVITAGLVVGKLKAEISGYRGREPDQNRYDIEAPKFDSIATRLSWNPTRTLALQVSYASQHSPEQVTPQQNQERYSASIIYTRPIGTTGFWSTTFAWGRRIDHEPAEPSTSLDAFVLESAIHPNDRWTFFGRAERVDHDELLPAPGDFHGPAFTVGKLSAGAIRDVPIVDHLKVGLGALASRTFVPGGLSAAYGGDRWSGEVFLRFRID